MCFWVAFNSYVNIDVLFSKLQTLCTLWTNNFLLTTKTVWHLNILTFSNMPLYFCFIFCFVGVCGMCGMKFWRKCGLQIKVKVEHWYICVYVCVCFCVVLLCLLWLRVCVASATKIKWQTITSLTIQTKQTNTQTYITNTLNG